MGAGMEDTDAVTAYFDKAEGHRSLVNFILNFLGSHNEMPVKILYVDKSATSTAITTTILERHEFDFQHFREVPEAIECLREDLDADPACSFSRLLGRVYRIPLGYRQAILCKQLFALILMKVHALFRSVSV